MNFECWMGLERILTTYLHLWAFTQRRKPGVRASRGVEVLTGFTGFAKLTGLGARRGAVRALPGLGCGAAGFRQTSLPASLIVTTRPACAGPAPRLPLRHIALLVHVEAGSGEWRVALLVSLLLTRYS
jgi:hypothetical protein